MGLTAWERQRDLVELKRLQCEKDLAEMKALPQWLLDENEQYAQRVRNLIVTIELNLEFYVHQLKNMERSRNADNC